MEESSGLIPRGGLVDKVVFSDAHADKREKEREIGNKEDVQTGRHKYRNVLPS